MLQTCHANNHRRPSYGAAINRDLPPHLQQQQQQFLPDQMSESESATMRLRGHSTVHTCCNGPGMIVKNYINLSYFTLHYPDQSKIV